VVNYESLGLENAFQGTCFEHAMSKACQCGTTYESEVFSNLHEISIKFAQSKFQKIQEKASRVGQGYMPKHVSMQICEHKNCQLPLRPSLCCTLGHFFSIQILCEL
jgi:hypothetical protein